MMLIAALATWLDLVLFFVVLCRIAASADGRDVALTERYSAGSATGLVVWKEQPELILTDPRARVPGARGRAERYPAGS